MTASIEDYKLVAFAPDANKAELEAAIRMHGERLLEIEELMRPYFQELEERFGESLPARSKQAMITSAMIETGRSRGKTSLPLHSHPVYAMLKALGGVLGLETDEELLDYINEKSKGDKYYRLSNVSPSDLVDYLFPVMEREIEAENRIIERVSGKVGSGK